MILVDTSVWVDHLRRGEAALVALLDRGEVLAHSFVIGELALGVLRQRDAVIGALHGLPMATAAGDDEVLQFIDDESLAGLGVGYIDVHLLASTRLTQGASFWTRDRRLAADADRLGVSARL
jgi:predicted nucleic acid-binding protein